MTEVLAALLLGAGLGTLVFALWPQPAVERASGPSRLELDDGTPRTLH